MGTQGFFIRGKTLSNEFFFFSRQLQEQVTDKLVIGVGLSQWEPMATAFTSV